MSEQQRPSTVPQGQPDYSELIRLLADVLAPVVLQSAQPEQQQKAS